MMLPRIDLILVYLCSIYLEILDNFSEGKIRSHSMQRIIRSAYYMKEYKECLNYNKNFSGKLLKKDALIVDEYISYCKNKI